MEVYLIGSTLGLHMALTGHSGKCSPRYIDALKRMGLPQ